MDTKTIDECNLLSHAGKITFPEVVKKLASTGTERYVVDLVGVKKTFYGAKGGTYVGHLNLASTAVPVEFDVTEIKTAIQDIQKNEISYNVFLRRIMAAGCSHYEVFIRGKKAIYFGRNGDHHTEHFLTPPSEPPQT